MVAALIILQAAILGVLIGGGFWLRHVVNQQLRLKDSQNEALRAERDQARAASAPALAHDLITTSKALDEMAGQKQKLQEDLNQLRTQAGKPGADGTERFIHGVGFGCLEGAMTIRYHLYDYLTSHKGEPALPTQFMDMLATQHNELLAKAQGALKGKEPNLTNANRYLSEGP